jgi:hypothetical protein
MATKKAQHLIDAFRHLGKLVPCLETLAGTLTGYDLESVDEDEYHTLVAAVAVIRQASVCFADVDLDNVEDLLDQRDLLF